jgi:putative tryptophan/tyrosine transport system substrate-binding protein
MRRRQFLQGLIGAAGVLPLPAQAEQSMPVIGLLAAPPLSAYRGYLEAFRQGVKEIGFIEGQNVTIEYRSADGQYDRLQKLAADLVARHVVLIVTMGGVPAALAAKAATSTVPIVFGVAEDPVKLGLVRSFAKPGGNATGVSFLTAELDRKRLELVREVLPKAELIGILLNPKNPQTAGQVQGIEEAAQSFGLKLAILNASSEQEIDSAYARIDQQHINALVIGADGFFFGRREQIVQLSANHALPTIFRYREESEIGGLMSYGTDLADAYRLEGNYVGRILKGEKPSELPVQQSIKVELVINLKSAKALGLTFPLSLLGRADEVIE